MLSTFLTFFISVYWLIFNMCSLISECWRIITAAEQTEDR